nr:hypothetical protein [Tanacetum cinerariifolium]
DLGGFGDDSAVRLIFTTCLFGLMWNSGLGEGDGGEGDDDDDAVAVVVGDL